MLRWRQKERAGRFRTPALWFVQSLVLAAFVGYLAAHWDYYGLPRSARPLHEAHGALRSSGPIGLWLGISAATLFVLNLGYLIRKRLVRIRWLGPLRQWMNLHVVTGVVGAGCVAVHMAMAPSSVMGTLALIAMGITVVTGIVGRTIYIRVPRSAEGRELEFKQVQTALERHREQLERAGVHAEWLRQGAPPKATGRSRLKDGLVALVLGDRQRREDYRRLKKQIVRSPDLRASRAEILPVARAYCMHWQWFVRYHELRNLIASWRFFHRWLAILMLFVVLGHVLVAVRFGGLSLAGGGH